MAQKLSEVIDLKSINLKKITKISLLISVVVITYYVISSYKLYLEIKDIKLKEREKEEEKKKQELNK